MISNFQIIVNTDKMLQYEKSNKIFGYICCQIDDVFFPDKLWSDFIVIILGWWVDALIKLIESSSQEEFSFMDGAFLFKIKIKKNNLCAIECMDEEYGDSYECEIFFDNFAQQVIEAAQKVIDKCKSENWKSDDLTILINNHEYLCKVAKSLIKTKK